MLLLLNGCGSSNAHKVKMTEQAKSVVILDQVAIEGALDFYNTSQGSPHSSPAKTPDEAYAEMLPTVGLAALEQQRSI